MRKFPARMKSGLVAVVAALGLAATTQGQAQVATTSITGGTPTDSIPAGTSGNNVLGAAGIGFAGGQIIVDGTLNVVSGGVQSPTVTFTLYDVGSESHWVNQIRLGNTTGAALTDDDDHQREGGGITGPFTNAPFTRIGTVTQAAGVADLEFWGGTPVPATMIVVNGQSPNQSIGDQPTSIGLAYLNDSYQIVTGPTERILVMLEDGGADRDYDDYVGILDVAAGSSASWGAVSLRVAGRPVSAPVQAFVTVTDVNGQPISGLTTTEITLLADGGAVSSPTLVLPPAQSGGSEHLSVVFAMDYSGSVVPATRQAMEDAVIDFISSMAVGDYAAIVKSNVTNPGKASVVQPFTAIAADNQALINAVEADYPGVGTNLYDAVILAVQQFSVSAGSLPNGPKAVIVLSDGLDNQSTVDVNAALEAANDASIPLFTVGVGETGNTNDLILTQLANETSGAYFPAPTNGHIGEATRAVFERLNNEYLLTFSLLPPDCGPYLLEARVNISAQTASAVEEFVRCTPLLVPDLVKQTLAAATTLLSNAGLTLGGQTQETSATVPAGSVIRHTPVAGTEVTPGSSVNLILSSGPPPGTVPNVVGQTQAAATTAITNASLVVGTVTQQSSTSVAAGSVISQSVAAGQLLPSGSAVDLVVSSGPPLVAVPTVTGLTQAAATSAITGASLVAGTVTQATSATVAAGNVISQTPSAGTQAAVGSAVHLVVSSGPPPANSGGSGGGGGAVDYAVVLMLLLLAGMSRRRRAASKSPL